MYVYIHINIYIGLTRYALCIHFKVSVNDGVPLVDVLQR